MPEVWVRVDVASVEEITIKKFQRFWGFSGRKASGVFAEVT